MNQQPQAEMAERIAEGHPGIKLAAEAVGVQDHKRMLAEYNRRLREGHLAQLRAIGMEDLADKVDNMSGGDINISGDSFTTVVPNKAEATSSLKPLAKYLMAAALALGSGAGGAGIASWMLSGDGKETKEPEETTDKDTQYELRLSTDK